MKTVIRIILLLVISGQTFATELYIGGMYGSSNLNYNTESLLWEEIATNQTAVGINAAFQMLGGSISVNNSSNSAFSKIFIGHRFNRYIGIEFFSFKMQPYKVNSTMSASSGGRLSNIGSNAGVVLHATGEIVGNAVATANLSGYGVRINGYVPLGKLDIISGVGVARAKSVVTLEYDINGTVAYGGYANVNYEGSTYIVEREYTDSFNNTAVFNDNGSDVSIITGIVPVFSLGAQYRLTKYFSLRGEAELVGLPVNGSAITTISGGMQYSF